MVHEAIFEAWQRFTTEGVCDEDCTSIISIPIMRSWRRCASEGLDPLAVCDEKQRAQLNPSHAQSAVMQLARSTMEDSYQFIANPGFAVVLSDVYGVVLDLVGDETVMALVCAAGLGPGANWSEERIGTNALDLALREAQPIQTSGAEHFCRAYHHLACAAAPFFDVAGGALGALAIVSRAEEAHAHTIGMVGEAAQALHNQLRSEQLLSEANDHLVELNAVLETMSEGLVFVSPQGAVRRINSRAAHMLHIVPRAATGRPLSELLRLPLPLSEALVARQEMTEQELLLGGSEGPLVAICGLRPVWDQGQRYLGALLTLRQVQSVHRLVQQVVGAQAQFSFSDIIGESDPMRIARHQARIAANSSAALLISGEPGVGKHMIAQAVHTASSRLQGPFITLNCAAVPRPLLAAELFGVEGSSSGEHDRARVGRPGKLELAQDGTLFLEEVSALPLDLQTDLLRAIETHHSIRSGGRRVVPVNARIIATSSTDLGQLVYEGRFRAELATRLSVISLQIPPLRERGDDLLLMVSQMLALLCERLGKQVVLAPEALHALRVYAWPGNIRELEVTLERLLHMTEKSVLTLADLPLTIAQALHLHRTAAPPLSETYDAAEREAILRAGRESGGHIGHTADLLGISRATLWRKMRRLALSRTSLNTSLR